jgi:hypothetical protein
MKRGRVCQTQRPPGSTVPGWIGRRGGLGQRVYIAMADYALTPSLRRLRSALMIVSVDPERRTPNRNL